MSKRLLLKNYLMRFGVVLVERTAGLIIVPVLITNVGLNGYGYYGLASNIVLVFTNVICLRFPMAMIRFYPHDRQQAGPVIAAGILFWAAIAGISVVALTFDAGGLASAVLANPEKARLLVLATVVGLLTTLYEFATVTLRAENRFGVLSIVDTGERILFVGLCLLMFYAGQKTVESVMLLLVATAILRIALVLAPSLRGVHWRLPERALLRAMFMFCLPFLPHLASVWLIERIGFFLVAQRLGENATGLLTVTFTLAALLLAVVMPLQTTLYPMLTRAHDQGRSQTIRELTSSALRFALSVGTLGTISLYIGAQHVFAILNIDEAVPEAGLLLLMCLAFVMSAVRQIIINLLHINKDTRSLVWISPVGALAALLVALNSIDTFGLTGAALAILAGTTLQTAAMAWRAPSGQIGYPSNAFYLALLLGSVVVIAVQTAAGYFGHWPYIIGAILSAIAYLAVLYRFGAATTEEREALRRLMLRNV